MAKHEEPYERDEKAQLPADCGHHCGTQKTGGAATVTRHCKCPECHGDVSSEIDQRVMPRNEGMDFRGIT